MPVVSAVTGVQLSTALPYLIVVGDSQQTTYTIPGLATGTWYFSVNAYTTSGVEGLPSNVASKTIN